MKPLLLPSRSVRPLVRRIGFSLVGERDRWPHILPVAAKLSRRPDVHVTLFVSDAPAFRAAHDLFRRHGGAAEADWLILLLPEVLERVAALPVRWMRLETVRLLCWADRMKACDILVASERTSALLRRLPGRRPLFARIAHDVDDSAGRLGPPGAAMPRLVGRRTFV